ncbi:PAS domain S-box protein [Chryseolinea sp. T2]|uniref:PAS domain S-box protein n=1 Tax=Chryseolinea sp. T2 TaxID=3129255 RepID=UPI003077839F
MIDRIKTWLNSTFRHQNGVADLKTMLFDTSPLPQAIITNEGVFLDVNHAYCTLHGLARADLIGRTPIDTGFASRIEVERALETFRQNNRRLEGYVLKYSTRNGILYARVFAHMITWHNRSAILMVLHDISRQRLTERAFKDSERFLQLVLDSIPTRVFWKDKNSIIVGCNRWAANDAGYSSPAELIGKTDFDLYPKEVANRFLEDDRRVMRSNTPSLFFEETLPQANGTSQWKLTSKVPLRNTDGSVIGLLGTYDDITLRKKAELDLKLARFSINIATSSMLWVASDGRIVDFNPAFSHLLQYSREELLKLRIPDIDPNYEAKDWPAHWERLRQLQTLTFLTKHRRKDGSEIDVEVRTHHLEFDDQEYHCAVVNDVTDRKLSEEKLRTSHRFLQTILNYIPDCVFWKDRESKYLGANALFMKVANCNSEEELLGKTDFDMPWLEHAEQLRADDREVMETNTSKLYYVEPLRNADGKIHYNLVTKVPLLDDGGKVFGVLGTFRDITQQLEVELALKESEKLFKSVVQNASAIIYIIDQQGRFRLSEGLGLAALGLKAGEVIGKSVYEMYGDVPEITDAIGRALKGEVIENEVTIFGITYATRYAPMLNEAGEISHILCISFDISSRKKLEQELNALNEELEQHVNELKESELKFRQIIQSSPMGIYVYEVDARGKLVLADTNPAADILTGIENQKLVGKTLEEAFPGLENTEMPARYLEAAVYGKPWVIEDFYFNNGTINGVFEVYAFQAGRNRVAVMFLNISERRQIEAAIKLKNEELVKTNAELDRFVYSASHDLRAPIASLLGLIAVARAERDMDGISSLLDMQERSLHKLDNFIQDIVSYSRNNRVEIELAPVDFRSIVEGIFEQLHHMDALARIERRILISPELKFSGDEKRISIILNNLISNAIKYCDLRKDRSYVEVCVEQNGKGITLSVNDNGEGISSEHLPRIFEMFFRATSRSSGSGIGLYIVNEMVNKMRGKVEVKSVKGEGSKFIISLPDLAIN